MTENDLLDAIIKGGKARLRPVLLTAITTISMSDLSTSAESFRKIQIFQMVVEQNHLRIQLNKCHLFFYL